MNKLLQVLQSNYWAMEPGTLHRMADLLIRHSRGERVSAEQVQMIVAARGDAGVDPGMQRIGDIAIVPITGVISKGAKHVDQASVPQGTSTGEIRHRVHAALSDPQVSAIVLAIDSPGGSVAGVEQLDNFIFKAAHEKPIVAYGADLCASAAYFMAAQATEIWTNATGEVGSVGVYTVLIDSSVLHESEGINVEVVSTAPLKGMLQPGTIVTDEQRDEVQRVIDGIFSVFVGQVARGRNISDKEVRTFADGRLLVGADAVDAGLVDAVGSMDDAINAARRLAARRQKTTPRRGQLSAPVQTIGATRKGVSGMNGKNKRTGVEENATEDYPVEVQGTLPVAGEMAAVAPVPVIAAQGATDYGIDVGVGVVQPAPACSTEPVATVPAPAPVGNNLAALQRQAVEAERLRAAEIRGIGEKIGLGATWSDPLVANGTSIDDAGRFAIDALAKQRQPLDVRVGEDLNKTTAAVAVRDAIMLRAGTLTTDGPVKPHGRAASFGGLSLLEIGRQFLSAHGVGTAGMGREEICQRLFATSGATGLMVRGAASYSHSASDFPLILQDAINKRLLAEYAEAPQTWRTPGLMRRRLVADFKNINAARLGEMPNLLEVKEGGEYLEATIGEEREVYLVTKYGQLFSITWETLINDDMDAFSRIPMKHGRAAARLVNTVAWNPIITADKGETMADGHTLFHSAHKNLTDAGGTINVAALSVARTLFRKQTGVNGTFKVGVAPSFLAVPPELETVAEQIIKSSRDPSTSNDTQTINPFQNRFQIVTEPLLGDTPNTGTTGWYLFADHREMETIEVAFLEGNEQPSVTQEDGFKIDGRTYKVRMVVGAKAIDHRGVYKNDGV